MKFFLISGLIFLTFFSCIPTSSVSNSDDLEILALYGTTSDYNLIQNIQSHMDSNFQYQNASIPWNADNLTNINQYKSIWIFYSLDIEPDLPKITSSWIKEGNGLFILSSQLNEIQKSINLQEFGIDGISPVTYPITTESETLLNLTTLPFNSLIDWPINETVIQINGRSNLISLNERMVPLASLDIPIHDYKSPKIRSGLFVSDNIKEKLVIGSFSIDTAIYSTNLNSEFSENLKISRKSVQSSIQIPELFSDLLVTLGVFSSIGTETSPNVLITPEIGDFFATFSIITIIIGLITLLLTKWREIFFGILVFVIGLIAHISYVPSRRRLNRTDLLENDTRSKILTYIENHPNGIHLREVQRNVGCGVSTLLWHLQTLEDFHLIESTKVGRYTIFLPIINNFTDKKTQILPTQSEQAKKIWDLLKRKNKPLDLATISKKTECHIETARYHLKKFEESGYVNKIKDKRTFYFIPPRIIKEVEHQDGHET